MTQTFPNPTTATIKKARNERYTTLQAMDDLRRHWFSHFDGNLSTICRAEHPLAGYPIGSVVPFVLDNESRPIILMAHIAEHTQNALANPKASLFLREHSNGDVQTQWRICAIGDLLPIPDAELSLLSQRYYTHYPQAQDYGETHHFTFFRLTPKKFRIIMGFGDIRWITADAPFQYPAFEETDILAMTTHMNQDHQAAMHKYLTNLGINEHTTPLTMTHLTPWGATIRNGDRLHFIPFPTICENKTAVRETLVAMAKT